MDNVTNAVIWPGWETVRKIGSGSFGSVYEIQRDVYGDTEKAAVKVISIPRNDSEIEYLRGSGVDEASIARVMRTQLAQIAGEYQLMSRMRDNPHIVQCSDFREVPHGDGLGWDLCIKMELLTPLMARPELVSTEAQIIRLGKEISSALITCQANDVLHRDIKPQNIFVSRLGQFKLGDFGIARTIERNSQATAGVGTYSYMAPEVVKNEPYGKSADVYSLGLLLYWCLNERRAPFVPLAPVVPSCTDEELAKARRFSGEPLPAPKNGSAALKQIVLKACAYNPADRYQTAQQLYDALCALQVERRVDQTVNVFGGSKTYVPVAPETPVQRQQTPPAASRWAEEPKPVPKKKSIWPKVGLTIVAIAAIVIGAITAIYLASGQNQYGLTLESYSFTDYYTYDDKGNGYVHVTPHTWHLEKDRPFWKFKLPDATTEPEGMDVTWEIVVGNDYAEIHPETNEVWIDNIGLVIAEASFIHEGVRYTQEYRIDFRLCKKTAEIPNTVRNEANNTGKGSKVGAIPGHTIVFIDEIKVFPDMYYEGGESRRQCLWGYTTYTDENGEDINGWLICSKNDIKSYPSTP